MRKSILGVLVILFSGAPTAQTSLPPPGTALYIAAAERQVVIEAHPGARGTQMKSVDAGKHVISVYVDQLKATSVQALGEMHTEFSEATTILEGTATSVTGGKLINPTPTAGFSFHGQFEGGVTRKVSAGDVIVLPPGTVHCWKSVDSPMLVYMNVQIDPTKTRPSGYVDPALKK